MPMLPLYNIRLGDAVVGRPTSTKGGVVQYDFWKVIQFLKHVSKKIEIIPGMETTHNYRDTEHGQLFEASYNHPKGSARRQLRCCQILAIILDSAIKLNLLVQTNERRAAWLNPIDLCDKAPNSDMRTQQPASTKATAIRELSFRDG